MTSSTPEPRNTTPVRALVRASVARAWAAAVAAGALPDLPEGVSAPPVDVERPANAEHGDFATNLALRLARPLRMAPAAIAAALADAVETGPGQPVSAATVAGPGFINLRLADEALEGFWPASARIPMAGVARRWPGTRGMSTWSSCRRIRPGH